LKIRQFPRVSERFTLELLHECNANPVFLRLVIAQCTLVWFNTSNFPKTEVGSGKTRAPVQTLENLEMKKTLVAIAALAAFGAQAQSTVTLKGTFDPSIMQQKTTYGGGNITSTQAISNNSQGTSQVTILGSEDLGGGLKANFLMENDFDSKNDSTNNFSSKGGEQFLGLSGGFGAVQFGAPNTPSLDVSGRTPFGTKIGSGFANGTGSAPGKGTASFGVQGLGHVRENNSIVYTAPTMSGFTPKIGYAFNNDAVGATNANPTAVSRANAKTDLGLSYVNGPLTAVIAQYQQKTKYKQTHGYVAYQIGALKATYGFNRDDRQATAAAVDQATATAWTTGQAATSYFGGYAGSSALAKGKLSGQNVAADYALASNINLLANVGKLNDKTTDNYDRKIVSVGVKYTLSPRTSLYARNVNEKLDNVLTASTWDKSKIKTTLVGIQHNF
jgi:GBP family porin